MTTTDAVREVLLAFADDEHLMGQQHTEWIGVAPTLEEDLAFSSIGQDELGHAAMLYELVLELDGEDTDDAAIDGLAYHRPADQYRSCALAEYSTDDWAQTLVRHWIYDAAEALRWELVSQSSLSPLADIAARAKREETFHRLHADALLDHLLADSTARERILAALAVVIELVPSLLAPPPGEAEAIADGVLSGSLADLAQPLREQIAERFDTEVAEFAVHTNGNGNDHKNGNGNGSSSDANSGASYDRGQRSEHFEPLMARMREVFEYDPEARW